jgi:hypothetical protein
MPFAIDGRLFVLIYKKTQKPSAICHVPAMACHLPSMACGKPFFDFRILINFHGIRFAILDIKTQWQSSCVRKRWQMASVPTTTITKLD